MPNLNAALGLGQIERLGEMLEYKRKIHEEYCDFFDARGIEVAKPLPGDRANCVNAMKLKTKGNVMSFSRLLIFGR